MESRPASKESVEVLPGLPDHEVLQELGRGGMGVVYLATNKVMGRKEVLKVVNPQMLAEPGAMDRFLQEIRSAAQLSHPNIVTAHAVLRSGESLVLAMEHIVGDNLYKVVGERGPLPIANACYYVHQAALGLQHAFDRGMVHRDIKPDNLMLARDGKKHTVKILDFGLAKATQAKDDKQHNLTGDGKMMGTPDYIAPEQILDAAKADIRADIYSLGCTLYFLLTGSPPFKDGSLYEKLQAHMSRKPTSVHKLRNEVPLKLAQIIDKMMAKDAKDRFQTPSEVTQALAPFVKGVKPLAAGDGKETSAGKSTTLTGAGGKSKGDGYTLVPTVTPKTKGEAATKKTMIEADASDRSKLRPKTKPPQSAPSAAKGKWILLIGGGLGVASVFMVLLCLIGLWAGGVFDGKRQPPIAENKDAKPLPAENKDAKPLPAENKDAKQQPVEVEKERPPAVGEAFVSLFNGRDLTGWKTNPKRPADWRVEQGVLVSTGFASGGLFSERGNYSDFHVRAEIRAGPGVVAGVHFRAPFEGPSGYRAFIDCSNPNLDKKCKTGGLGPGQVGPILVFVQKSPAPAASWFTMDIVAKGNHLNIMINGQVTADYQDQRRLYTSGHILLGVPSKGRLEFRKIEIKEFISAPVPVPVPPLTPVPPPPVEPTPKEDLFVPLFNGKDTGGWKTPPDQAQNGSVKDGILTLAGKTPSYLYSERDNFKNFHLSVEARVKDGSYGGVYLRVADMAKKPPQGYKVLLNSKELALDKAGSLFNPLGTSPPGFGERLFRPDEWFKLEVVAIKSRIVVKINGKVTADYTDDKQAFASGHIVLEQYDAETVIDFKKIDIRELAADAKMPFVGAGPGPIPGPGPGPVVNPNPQNGGKKIVLNIPGILRATDQAEFTDQGFIRGRFKIHAIQMVAGKTYVISLNSNAFDAYLRLQNPQGKVIAQDDDGGGGLNARISHRCTATGVYRIVATSFDGKIGPYQLIVQEAP